MTKLNPIDHPWMVNAGVLVVVACHAVATQLSWIPNVWSTFLASQSANQSDLYLGFVGIAGIVAAVAGIVVVFGLTSTSLRFREFRVQGGQSLARNWSSTTASGLVAAGFAFLASVAAYTGIAWAGPWLLETAILLTAHASVRLIWLLRGMINIIRADDVAVVAESKKRKTSSMPWNKAS